MSDVAIRVAGLGKQYRIGVRPSAATFRDALNDMARLPKRLMRAKGTKGQDKFWALQDVSFEVKQGDVVGVIGRNGAGKSTLLKVLSRITEPTCGEADIYGRVGSLLEVGTGFHHELTGRENIYLNGAILGMRRTEIARKFDEIVAFAEVEKFIDTPVKHYSSGMYMRLAFAVAAHLEPEILVVDEVLAVGDANFQKKCLGKMGEVARGGRTVLFVSHNMAAVQSLCQTVVRLDGGRLLSFGPAAGEVAAYLTAASAHADGDTCERQLGSSLRLVSMRFAPPVLSAGDTTKMTLVIRATEDVIIDHLCGLIFSPLDVRVGIIDLRSESGSYHLRLGQTLTVEADVRRLNLVPGAYKAGLFLFAGATVADFHDLAAIDIVKPERASVVAPYPESARGVVEFDHSLPRVTIAEEFLPTAGPQTPTFS